MWFVAIYLAAIITANLLISHFGPAAAPVIAGVLIGLDIVARDRLHEQWHGNHLLVKMGVLIGTGGLLSWLINPAAGDVALASTIAFLGAGTADALIYHAAYEGGKVPLQRINLSNVGAALVDSLLFFPVAFGTFPLVPMASQVVAKVVGGFLWSLLLVRLFEYDG